MPFIRRLERYQKMIALPVVVILFVVLFGCGTMPASPTQPFNADAGAADSMDEGDSIISQGEVPGATSGTPGDATKPVGFINHGSIAATVMAWTYLPVGSDVTVEPPTGSTVTFPPTAPGLWPNPSRFLALPLGTYTWCYYWDTGDQNDDGYIEYFHAFDTRPVVLDESDQDDLELAESVDLDVPPASGILPGKCAFEQDALRFGNNCVVYLEAGIVLGGQCGQSSDENYYIVDSGTFDGEKLYIVGHHEPAIECNTDEFWFTVAETTVTQNRWKNQCGTEWVGDVVLPRWE